MFYPFPISETGEVYEMDCCGKPAGQRGVAGELPINSVQYFGYFFSQCRSFEIAGDDPAFGINQDGIRDKKCPGH